MTVPAQAGTRTNCFYSARVDLDDTVGTDFTGRFPTTSLEGNKYVMVLFSEDANRILAQPVKNRSELGLVNAKKELHNLA